MHQRDSARREIRKMTAAAVCRSPQRRLPALTRGNPWSTGYQKVSLTELSQRTRASAALFWPVADENRTCDPRLRSPRGERCEEIFKVPIEEQIRVAERRAGRGRTRPGARPQPTVGHDGRFAWVAFSPGEADVVVPRSSLSPGAVDRAWVLAVLLIASPAARGCRSRPHRCWPEPRVVTLVAVAAACQSAMAKAADRRSRRC
jgi:hypothetical protein